jgi:hypothetical protein
MRAQAPLKRHGGCRRALIELAQDLLEHAKRIAIFILLISYAAVGDDSVPSSARFAKIWQTSFAVVVEPAYMMRRIQPQPGRPNNRD